jgi:hypothetical protein
MMLQRSVFRKWASKALNAPRAYQYHKEHKKEAETAIGVIGTHNSQRLTPTLKKMADEYSSDVFGSRRYAPWLYVYSLVSGRFKEGWIPDNFFGSVVSPRVNREVGVVTSLKSFSNVVLKTEALPDIGYYIGGNFYSRDLAVTDPSRLRAQCGSTKGKLFVKKDRSSRGEGIITLTVEQLTEGRFSRIGDCVIQLPITQNEFFEEMIAGSVATIRLTTVKDQNGRIDVRAAYLRLGRSNTEWVRSDNSIRVAITDRAGQLDNFCYTGDWRRWKYHPDTGYSFKNARIPKFKEAIDFCVALHSKVPHFTIIGWDVTIDNTDQIKIMEWNSNHPDIKFSEANTGPCFVGLNWEMYAKISKNGHRTPRIPPTTSSSPESRQF